MDFEKRPLRGPARDRFRALLKLASESPFQGERENALAAATRLAESHGLTLDEAARPAERLIAPEPSHSHPAPPDYAPGGFATYFDLAERNLKADKARREAALRDAVARGLDRDERKKRERPIYRASTSSRAQRSPRNHARVLLSETTFSLKEIVDLTGLDIYEVVGLKLKMRAPA